ncbi:ImmA/IrrE family metallo-endopeptidase [Pseudomonas cannabina]|uniref:DNA-binding protein n=1 Tax=Pseudomonas cannabina TaxID=86840 RepID=A0A0P9LWN1_PSECA|nr:ImmA/IrrE family metallo-endopeptidase [Pseudomonas cannabina]KAA8700184.1 ImmA/IrrE family metallo-endopeptidase [Pseudomonas cannabina]KPW74906.1 DNA-binding protein [Pseudomonas cannabina]RMN22275.1 DNA-binding protein [Pseudomonas cannabina]SDR42715.1 Zn-dependent peptidase ImmA, M78 family [Pseudomonas cannabina]
MSQVAFVNPSILTWSRERAGLSAAQLARKLPVKPERVEEWEAGEAKPTFLQAQKWASVAHVPFGFLFLLHPPVEPLPLPDLRTVGNSAPLRPSLELLDTVKDAIRKQDWYLEYLYNHEQQPLAFVGRFDSRSPVKAVVNDIRQTLGVDPETSRLDYDKYSRALIDAAEMAGVLVMRSGIALGNTHRKLEVSEFRGFAISNPLAPVVFINSSDAPTARLFTLMHELAHIWIGSSGVSDASTLNGREEERFCNAVAGEFLVPEERFRSLWNSGVEWESNLAPLATRFHVSKLVIGRRALDLGFVTQEQYGAYYQRILKAFQDEKGGAGNYYRNATAKNSTRLSRAVLIEAMSGRMLLREAGNLLGVQPAKLRTLSETMAL